MRIRSVCAALAAPLILAGGIALATASAASASGTNLKIPPGAVIDLTSTAVAQGGSGYTPVTCDNGTLTGDIMVTVQSGHQNISSDGSHVNATIVGQGAFYDNSAGFDPVTGNPIDPIQLTPFGHTEAWMTINLHANGSMQNEDAINAKIDGLNIHLHGSFNVAPDGTIRVNKQTASC
jgi:ABC-type transport system substrate-binding protein